MDNNNKPETRQFTFRIRESAHSKLEQIAAQEDRSISWLVNRAIEDYLKKEEPLSEADRMAKQAQFDIDNLADEED